MNANASFECGCAPAQRCEICPLTAVRAGVAVRIRRLCAAPEVQDRLRELGFCEDQIIRLLANQTSFICQICNARLAISEQLARLIWVEPVSQPAAVRPG
jgi:Fe2+ transport system protein FeoA